MKEHLLFQFCQGAIQLDNLLAGGKAIAQGCGLAASLFNRLGDCQTVEIRACTLDESVGVIESTLGLSNQSPRCEHFVGCRGTLAGPRSKWAKRPGKTVWQEHGGRGVFVAVGSAIHWHQAGKTGAADLLSETAGCKVGLRLRTRDFRDESLQSRYFIAETGDSSTLFPDDRLHWNGSKFAG